MRCLTMNVRNLMAVALASACAAQLFADPAHVDPHAYLEHIKYLASDELEGRGDGAPGLEKAAEYIANGFRAAGLEPIGDNGTFFQRFELVSGLSIAPGNVVTLTASRRSLPLTIGKD